MPKEKKNTKTLRLAYYLQDLQGNLLTYLPYTLPSKGKKNNVEDSLLLL